MNKQEIIYLVKKLISFKSETNNQKEIDNCINYIERYFSNSNLFVKKYFSASKPSLLISNKPTSKFDLLFNGHIDVVGADDRWFKPKVSKNKIIGRGAIDMKGSIAVLMALFKNLPKTKKNIGLMIVSDEEIDGNNGTKFLLQTKKITPKITIICEESNFNVVIKQKGQITIKIETRGKSGHGSQPWTGTNAIEKLMIYYAKIRKLFPKIQKNKWNSMSINIGKFTGGIAPNVIADKAELLLDIRYPTLECYNLFIKKLNKLAEDSQFKYSILSKTSPMTSGNVSKYIKTLNKITKITINRRPEIKWTNYCSDGRYFSDKNLPVIEFGPIGANYHAGNEYVNINSLIDYYKILQKFITSLK